MKIMINTLLFYFQILLLNNQFNTENIETNYLNLVYPVIFSMSYTAIITKVDYKLCNVLCHSLLIVFLYTYKYLVFKEEVFPSLIFVFEQLMKIDLWNRLSIKYDYLTSFKPFITYGSILTILDKYKHDIMLNLPTVIEIYNIHILAAVTVCIICLCLFQEQSSNEGEHFDLVSKRNTLLGVYSICSTLIVLNTTRELYFYQAFSLLCAYKNYSKLYFLSLPLSTYVSPQNFTQMFFYFTSLKYNVKSRLYCYNIVLLVCPSISVFIGNSYSMGYIKYAGLMLYPIVWLLYKMYRSDYQNEQNICEENSIKNKIDIIINE